jgi:type II secretory pathway component PulF
VNSAEESNLRCSARDLCNFTRQISVMVRAGVPIHEAFGFMHRAGRSDLCQIVAPSVAKHLEHGHRLSTSLSLFPRVFPRSYVVLVQAAEQTGALHSALERIAELLDRQLQLRRHVIKALSYPAIVVVVTAILTLALFNSVIPDILDTVLNLGGEMPTPTLVLVAFVEVLQHPLSWLLLVGIGVVFVTYIQNPAQRDAVLGLLTRMPILGKVLLLSANAKYAQTLALLLHSGIDVMRASRVAARSSGNPLLVEDSARVNKLLREGLSLSEVWVESSLYSPLLKEMADIGAEIGKIPLLLQRCGDLLETQAYDQVNCFVQLLEPIMLSAIAAGVGFVLVSILMPLLALTAGL